MELSQCGLLFLNAFKLVDKEAWSGFKAARSVYHVITWGRGASSGRWGQGSPA